MTDIVKFLRTNWKTLIVGASIIWLIWFSILITLSINHHQIAVDQCVVDQFEREDGISRDDLYEYCRAKARISNE